MFCSLNCSSWPDRSSTPPKPVEPVEALNRGSKGGRRTKSRRPQAHRGAGLPMQTTQNNLNSNLAKKR